MDELFLNLNHHNGNGEFMKLGNEYIKHANRHSIKYNF